MAALAAGTAAAYALSGAAPGAAATGATPPSTATVTAVDFDWSMPGGADYTATIAAGGTVSFSYPSGAAIHNVDFLGASPTACTQLTGAAVGSTSPLPATPEAPGWSGICRFDTPGTYAFVCDDHNYMKGTIEVEAHTTTTTATSAATTGAGSSAPPAEQTPGAGPPTSGGPTSLLGRPRVRVAHRQRGAMVRGTVTTPAGRSQIRVTAYLSGRGSRVGSQTKRSKGAGRTAFAVTLDATARRALQRAHRLSLDLRIVITPAAGRPVTTKTVAVALRDR